MSQYPIHLDIDVAWGDMDALGHVNNVMYLRYFESVRIKYFSVVGLPMPKPGEAGVGPILATQTCNYKRPVVYPDRLRAETGFVRMGTSSVTFSYRLYSHGQQEYVADSEAVIVFFNFATGKSEPIPAPLRAAMENLQKSEG